MRRNTLILATVLIAAAFITYFGYRPDLVASKIDDGSGIRVSGPALQSSRVFLGSSSDNGFQGTWVYGVATADFPSSHMTTHRLTLNQDGTASLVEEERNRVSSRAEAEYRTETRTRNGTWTQHGQEAWIELD